MKLNDTTNDARRVSTTFIRISLALFLTTAISTAQTFGVAHIDSGAVVNQTAGFDLNVGNSLAGVFELGIGGIPGTPLLQADGVLIANIVHGNSGIATVGGELTGDSASGSYALFTTSFVGNDQNRDTSLACFPFADGWQGGHFASDGSAIAASLPAGSTMTPLGVASDGAMLYSLVIAGVDSRTDGMLFVMAQRHSTPSRTNVINAAPMADGTWTIAMREEAAPLTPNDAFSIVYVPYDTASLVGGLIDDTGSVLESRGSFAVMSSAVGTYEITIPGVTSAADGVLLVSTAEEGTTGGNPPRRGIVYDFNAALGAFEVKTRQTGISPPFEDTGFVFTFLRFDTPLFPAAGYVGTKEDLITETQINGGPLSDSAVAELAAGDAITLCHSSPGGTFAQGGPAAVIGSVMPTGDMFATPFPGLHVNVANAFLIFGGTVSGYPIHMPAEGICYGFTYGGGAAGASCLIQCIVSDGGSANGIFASTDGLEIRFQ